MNTIEDLVKDARYSDRLEDGIPVWELRFAEAIRIIQDGLTRAGYPVAVDGLMGPITGNTWRQFKIDNQQRNPDLVGLGSLRLLELKGNRKPIDDQPPFYQLTRPRRLFMDLIAWSEGTDRVLGPKPIGYNIIFSGITFEKVGKNFLTHPRYKVKVGGYVSDAAGRYQIMSYTWDLIQRSLHLPTFEPIYQDQACVWLIHVKRGGLRFVDSLDLWNFCQKCNTEWASLPGSPYGQPTHSYSALRAKFFELKKRYGL